MEDVGHEVAVGFHRGVACDLTILGIYERKGIADGLAWIGRGGVEQGELGCGLKLLAVDGRSLELTVLSVCTDADVAASLIAACAAPSGRLRIVIELRRDVRTASHRIIAFLQKGKVVFEKYGIERVGQFLLQVDTIGDGALDGVPFGNEGSVAQLGDLMSNGSEQSVTHESERDCAVGLLSDVVHTAFGGRLVPS